MQRRGDGHRSDILEAGAVAILNSGSSTPTSDVAVGTDDQPTYQQQNVNVTVNRDGNENITFNDDNRCSIDCPICLQKCIYPVRLPCSHIFCFLCAKGNAQRSNRCALCRQDIPQNFFWKPNLVQASDEVDFNSFDNSFQWYYEGRNGWWQYDTRTSTELERRYKKGETNFEQLIAGWLYVIDFENMVQYRKNSEGRKRKIKRDLINIPEKKGVAGLVLSSDARSVRPDSDGEPSVATASMSATNASVINNIDSLRANVSQSPPAPNNTPLTPQTPAESPPITAHSSYNDLSARLEHLDIGNDDDDDRDASDRDHSNDNQTLVSTDSSPETEEDISSLGARSTYI